METDPDEIGFVVCAACGARIKADREWCLRCHEPLVAWKRPEIPLPSWVRALGGGTLIFGVVGVAALGLVAYVSLDSGSARTDELGRRAPQARKSAVENSARESTRRAIAIASAPARESDARHVEPIVFIDTTRRGVSPIADRDLDETRVRLEHAVQNDPKDADAQNNLGLVLERLKSLDAAVDHLSQAVALDSRNWIYHFNLAHVLSQQRRWNRAASEYAATAEIIPGDYAVQYDLAAALHMSSNEPAAIRAFEKAIELAPDEPGTHLALAVSLDAGGRADDALMEYRRYLEMAPVSANAGAVKARMQSLSRQS